MTATHPDFRVPPQGWNLYCLCCLGFKEAEIGWREGYDWIECDHCDAVGQWGWRLRYRVSSETELRTTPTLHA